MSILKIDFRPADRGDLEKIIKMLADDKLGATRENYQSPLPVAYINAFEAIVSDPNQHLCVALIDNEVIATYQLTFIPYLTYQGGIRALVEAVRVRSDYRGKGVGKLVFKEVIRGAKEKGAHLLQLTTDKKRPEAVNFYKSLGFKSSHEGMKLHLDPN